MIALLMAGAVAAMQPPTLTGGKGLLIGCFFPTKATDEIQPLAGIGIYLSDAEATKVLSSSVIRDPDKLLTAGGFDRVERSSKEVTFVGGNTLILRPNGGGIFAGNLTETGSHKSLGEGTCQLGETASADEAFRFFDALADDLRHPEKGEAK